MSKVVKDSLGDRMKGYENVSRIYLTKRTPVIIRLDGKSFHTFTRGFKRPFDLLFRNVMTATAQYLCENISGCKLAYVQSDEISLLLTDLDTVDTQPWFDNNLQKLVSVSASMATLKFNRAFANAVEGISDAAIWRPLHLKETYGYEITKELIDSYLTSLNKGATFDARAFILPREEVCNYFIWRQQDATRNSIQMVAQSYFSHKQLQGKNTNQLQDILFTEHSVNWNDFDASLKRGVCIKRTSVEVNGAIRHKWGPDSATPIFTTQRDYIDSVLDNKENL